MTAPKPSNFDELSDAWNNPLVFARELAVYYAELKRAGYVQSHDYTEPKRSNR